MLERNLSAMVLAAGKGQRMGERTRRIPKPLIKVAGKTLIDYTLDNLAQAGVQSVVVNLHSHADLLQTYLEQRIDSQIGPLIKFSSERSALLDTGGAIVRALPLLSSNPFFVSNSDVVRLDRGRNACHLLHEAWNPAAMDFLLLVHSRKTATGFDGRGDFFLGSEGQLTRRGARVRAPYVYAGLCLCSSDQFRYPPGEVFSLNDLWNRACKKGRLVGVQHDGTWLHVGSPEELKFAEDKLGNV